MAFLYLLLFILNVASNTLAARQLGVTGPINSFGVKLLRHTSPGQNVMISPFSICTAVAMLNAGARGNTKAQIDAAFGWERKTNVSGQYEALLGAVSSGGASLFNISSSNRMYVDHHFQPLESYTNTLADNFGADLERVNFGSGDNSDTVEEINSWVESQTNGKIQKMFSEIESNTKAILINTIYFNAEWLKPFTETSKSTFFLKKGDPVQVETMRITERFKYFRNEVVEVVELPYHADKSDISMIVIQPTAKGGLLDLERKVIKKRFSKISKWIKNVEKSNPEKFFLSMPKFEFGSKLPNLQDTLQEKFGVRDVFDAARANLSGINGGRNLFVSSIIHQSFIAVDEKRTEAAAATAVQVAFRSRAPPSIFINQPFLFVIYDHHNKVVLFIGRVTDPRIGN